MDQEFDVLFHNMPLEDRLKIKEIISRALKEEDHKQKVYEIFEHKKQGKCIFTYKRGEAKGKLCGKKVRKNCKYCVKHKYDITRAKKKEQEKIDAEKMQQKPFDSVGEYDWMSFMMQFNSSFEIL
jgi:hypothetical protein